MIYVIIFIFCQLQRFYFSCRGCKVRSHWQFTTGLSRFIHRRHIKNQSRYFQRQGDRSEIYFPKWFLNGQDTIFMTITKHLLQIKFLKLKNIALFHKNWKLIYFCPSIIDIFFGKFCSSRWCLWVVFSCAKAQIFVVILSRKLMELNASFGLIYSLYIILYIIYNVDLFNESLNIKPESIRFVNSWNNS